MFRDESSKVIQKAHASWGVEKSGTVGTPPGHHSSASSSASSASSWGSSSPSSTTSSEGQSPPYRRSSTTLVPGGNLHVVTPKMYRKVEPTIEQKGLQFFLDRYLLGQPDAPTNNEQLAAYSSGPAAMQNVMIAVGLAGLSNTVGDRAMNMLSRQKYTQALTQVQGLIAAKPTGSATVIPPLRIVVTLALFEVVQGSGNKLSTGTANVHIFGAIALLRSALPIRTAPAGGVRGILQLMFSLFIPSQLTETPLPPVFFEALTTCKQALPPNEHCCCDIAVTIARFLRLISTLSSVELSDADQMTEGYFQQLLELDETLARLEDDLQKAFPFEVEYGNYPPAAVFQGKYHIYSEIWGARLWNHLRWARILIVQKILDLSAEFPICGAQYVHPMQRDYCLATVRRMAEDIIVSTPSHWHHPILDQDQARKFAAGGKGGSGGVGLPTLLWHLKIAGCAPGVPDEYWEWAHDLVGVVWKTMGMQHAFALSEVMQGHKAGLEKEAIDRILKIEDRDY